MRREPVCTPRQYGVFLLTTTTVLIISAYFYSVARSQTTFHDYDRYDAQTLNITLNESTATVDFEAADRNFTFSRQCPCEHVLDRINVIPECWTDPICWGTWRVWVDSDNTRFFKLHAMDNPPDDADGPAWRGPVVSIMAISTVGPISLFAILFVAFVTGECKKNDCCD